MAIDRYNQTVFSVFTVMNSGLTYSLLLLFFPRSARPKVLVPGLRLTRQERSVHQELSASCSIMEKSDEEDTYTASCERVLFAERSEVLEMLHELAAKESDVEGDT